MIKKIIKSAIGILGYEMHRKISGHEKLGYELEEEANAAIQIVRPYTMLPHARLLTLYQQVVFCEKHAIPGSYVECGVWKGGAVALMALANLKYGKKRRPIHLFDAFQEICEPDASIDGEKAVNEARMWSRGNCGGKLVPLTGFYDALGGPGSLEESCKLLVHIIGYDAELLYFHKGWFQDTLPADAKDIGDIAILRLDGDWYASTKICLEHLYDKVVKGGFLIIDDYGTYEGCKKAVDEFTQQQGVVAYLHHVDHDCRYLIKP